MNPKRPESSTHTAAEEMKDFTTGEGSGFDATCIQAHFRIAFLCNKTQSGQPLGRLVSHGQSGQMQFVKETFIKATPERVFAFHELPDAFERLIPPWEKIKIIETADISKVGSRTIVEAKIFGPFKKRLVAEHTAYDPPRSFEDVQISGPFRSWRHRHIVEPLEGGAVMRDEVEFEPPLAIFGPLAAPLAIMPRLEKLFSYRHEVTKKWCEAAKA